MVLTHEDYRLIQILFGGDQVTVACVCRALLAAKTSHENAHKYTPFEVILIVFSGHLDPILQ